MGGRLPVATPALLFTGELDGWPYVVTSRIDGVPIADVWRDLPHDEHRRLATELGSLARELHGLDAADEPESWRAFFAECRERARTRDREVPALGAEVEPFLEQVGELGDERHVLLHTELLDQHVFVAERRGRWELSALIDFADARVGPPEYDVPALVEFLFRGEPGLLRSFLVAYGTPESELDDERSERLLAWGLTHRYGSLARMLECTRGSGMRIDGLRDLARSLYSVE